jgi:hypothetical protein
MDLQIRGKGAFMRDDARSIGKAIKATRARASIDGARTN